MRVGAKLRLRTTTAEYDTCSVVSWGPKTIVVEYVATRYSRKKGVYHSKRQDVISTKDILYFRELRDK